MSAELGDIKKKLNRSYKKLKEKYGDTPHLEGKNLLDYLMWYFLMYRTPISKAKKVFRILTSSEEYVDWNEIRVTPERELRELFEVNKCDPLLARKMQTVLFSIFENLNEMSLEALQTETQEKSRKKLLSIEGLSEAIVVWLLILSHQYKNIPVDHETHSILIRLGIIPPNISYSKVKKILKELVPKKEGLLFHFIMIEHGKKVCREEGEMKCKRCHVSKTCAYFKLTQGKHVKEKDSRSLLLEAFNAKKERLAKKEDKAKKK